MNRKVERGEMIKREGGKEGKEGVGGELDDCY